MTDQMYFKIGLFVIVGIIITIGFSVMLGASDLFKHYISCETYFNESVQGLEEGSPVMFRGVHVGSITKIALASTVYRNESFARAVSTKGYIYIRFKIYPSAMGHDIASTAASIRLAVKQGMRISLATQGLVGSAYLETTMVDPKQNPALDIEWKPELPYIPSAKSRLTRFSDNVEGLFKTIDDLKLPKVSKDLDDAIISLNAAVSNVDTKRISQGSIKALTAIAASGNEIFSLIMSNRQSVNFAIKNLAAATSNVRILTNDLKQNPSRAVFGQAPPHWENQR